MSRQIQSEPAESAPGDGLLDQRPQLAKVSLIILFLLAVAVRANFIGGPGVVPDRQYRSLLIARSFFYDMSAEIPAWKKTVARVSAERQEPLEPRLTEIIVGVAYRMAGTEATWIGKAVVAFLWLLGGLPLYLLARKLGSVDSAVTSLAYYLLAPFGVLLSLSFLPEPLMILMLLFSLLSIVTYFSEPTGVRLITAACVSGFSIFAKPLIVFVVIGCFVALTIHERGLRKLVSDRALIVFVGLSLLPSGLYYGYGVLWADYLRWKVDVSFLPHLFLAKSYWEGWLLTGINASGFSPLIIALVGVTVLRRSRTKAVLLGLWAGYAVFGLTFNYFVRFATYYHAQLLVVVSLSIGPIVAYVLRYLRESFRDRHQASPLLFVLAIVVFVVVKDVESGQNHPQFEDPEMAAEIGAIVNHSTRVAYLSHVYGLPLEYYGDLAGEYWPRRTVGWPLNRGGVKPRSINDRMASLGFAPEYFVITTFAEYDENHDDLKAFLESRCELVAESDRYLIYSLPPGPYDM